MRALVSGLSSAWFLLMAAVLANCNYDPKFKDGALKCSASGECPSGYVCRADACYSKGSVDNDGSTAGGRDAGLGGDALPPALLNRYIGEWTLDPTSVVVTQCGGGTPETTPLSPLDNPSKMTISAGVPGVSDLESSWLCKLGLRLDATGAHLYRTDTDCSESKDGVKQTWTATSFDIMAMTGRAATHTATYDRVDQPKDGAPLNCSQTVTASMTKK